MNADDSASGAHSLEPQPRPRKRRAMTSPLSLGKHARIGETQPMTSLATLAEFGRIDIRVGTITAALPFPEARKPAIKLWIDFGPELGVKQSSAQIARHYAPDRLLGRQVCAVVNFPPRQIGPFRSEVLTLGMPDAAGEVVLVAPDQAVPNGGRLF